MERTNGQVPQGSAFTTDKSKPVPDPGPLAWMFKNQEDSNLFGSDHLPKSMVSDALRAVVEVEHGRGPVTRMQEKGYQAGRNTRVRQNASDRPQTQGKDKVCAQCARAPLSAATILSAEHHKLRLITTFPRSQLVLTPPGRTEQG